MDDILNNNSELLSVRDLKVEYSMGPDTVYAVNNVSFNLEKGKTLALAGETGAGKTTIAKSILRILPDHSLKHISGEVFLEGRNILEIEEKEMRKLRGGSISMIFQDPMTALNPVKNVVDQIAEGIALHQKKNKQDARIQALRMLEMVGISADRANEYPHQFSGGMKQRVVIAIALVCRPALLIADEPTTALDVTIQAQVLELIGKLQNELRTSMILITHDLGIVAEYCDSIAIVYAGEILEMGSKEDLFDHPLHPYTLGLFAAIPDLTKDKKRLSPILGLPPDPSAKCGNCCSFAPRCSKVTEECRKRKPEYVEVAPGHYVKCIHA